MKRIVSFTLALVFCLSLFACTKADNAGNQNPDDPKPEPPAIIHKTYNLASERDVAKIKINGRSKVGTGGIYCDSSVSGIEFNAYVEGELKLTLNVSQSTNLNEKIRNECYFTLYIDGVRWETRLSALAGNNTLTLANFETGAMRNVKLVKQTGAHAALCTLKSLEFTGYFGEKPADKELLVEFIGDSITVGYGNLCTDHNDPNRGQAIMQDGTKAFAYLTAEKLGADISSICVSGMGIAKGHRQFLADEFFDATSYYRDPSEKYTATRKPDVIVINLGTNDQNKQADSNELIKKVKELITLVRQKYGKDTPIVWVHGMMGNGKWQEINSVLNKQFKGEADKIYTLEISQNSDGGGGHPGLAAHESTSATLSAFIKTKVLGK